MEKTIFISHSAAIDGSLCLWKDGVFSSGPENPMDSAMYSLALSLAFMFTVRTHVSKAEYNIFLIINQSINYVGLLYVFVPA